METHSKQFFSRHEIEPLPKHISPIIVADSFSTPSNVGSIIRLGANIGALRVIVINGEHLRESKIKKTAEPLPEKMVLVLGNEKFGMSEKILMQCQEIRYIPMPGKIKSMNVSHAASVGLFEWYRQQQG